MGARAGGGAEIYVVDLRRLLGITISILNYISARREQGDILGYGMIESTFVRWRFTVVTGILYGNERTRMDAPD